MGVGSVVLPGTVVSEGATLGSMACPDIGATLKPGFIHMGTPAQPIIKAPPGSFCGEVPHGRFLRTLVALLPFIQICTALTGCSLSIAAAAFSAFSLRHLVAGRASLGPLVAAFVTAVLTIALPAAGLVVKHLTLGQLEPAEGIQKFSFQNLARMLLSAVDAQALSLFGEAVKGSVWYNRVLRSRGLQIGSNVYVDTQFAGDYELICYGDNAIVDRDALVFAHLGLYKDGTLAMSQKSVEIKEKAVISTRAAVLPGSVINCGQVIPPGAVKFQL